MAFPSMPALRLAGLALLGVCGAVPAAAEEAPLASDAAIVVKGQLIDAQASAWSATEIASDQLRVLGSVNFDRIFDAVPGMAVRDLGLGGVANSIVIRGFGSGGHGGDLGAVIDGIPLNEAMSHADGYVDFNLIVPLEVDRLTVFRGPVSSLYGTYNRGGLVRIETRKGGNYALVDGEAGSFATGGLQFAAGREFGESQRFNIAGQVFLTDGYRPRSDQERQTLAVRWGMDPGEGITLALSGRYHHAEANSASYLTEAQFERDPYGIDARTQNDGARKHYRSLRGDLGVDLGPDTTLLVFGYGTRQDFTRWFTRPVGGGVWRQREESYDRDIFGAGASLNGSIPVFGEEPWTYVVGVEAFREKTAFAFYDGLDRRVRGSPALSDRVTRLNSLSAFGEFSLPLHPLFRLSLGGRYDRYIGGCSRAGAETGSDPCDRLDARDRFNPKVGVLSRVVPWLELRGSWAQGFALPNAFIKYAVGGQPLKDNLFRQTEIGARLTPAEGLVFDIAAYRLKSTAEIRTVAPGVFENFGATLRRGLEASAEFRSDALTLRAVYGLADTKVLQNADARLVGKGVAGVPRHTANVDVEWRLSERLAIDGSWRHVGSYAADALRTRFAPAYDLFDLGVAWKGAGTFAPRLWLRAENIADSRYATSVSLIGGEALFATGAPRTIRAGIALSL